MAAQPDSTAGDVRIAAVSALPESIAEDGHGGGGAAAPVVIRGEHAADPGWHSQGTEIIAAHVQALDRPFFAAAGKVEGVLIVGERGGENVLAVADLPHTA